MKLVGARLALLLVLKADVFLLVCFWATKCSWLLSWPPAMASVSQEGNPVVPSWARDKLWVSGDDPGVLSTMNMKNLEGFGRDFEHNRRECLGWIPSYPFFSLIKRSFWVIVMVEPSSGKQQHSCRGLQEFILGFCWHCFYIRDGKSILTYLVYLLVNIFHFHMHPALQCVW